MNENSYRSLVSKEILFGELDLDDAEEPDELDQGSSGIGHPLAKRHVVAIAKFSPLLEKRSNALSPPGHIDSLNLYV